MLSCENVENSLTWNTGNEATDLGRRDHRNMRPKLGHDHSPISPYQNLPHSGYALATQNQFTALGTDYPISLLRSRSTWTECRCSDDQHSYCACQHLTTSARRVQRPNTPSSQWKVSAKVTGTLTYSCGPPHKHTFTLINILEHSFTVRCTFSCCL